MKIYDDYDQAARDSRHKKAISAKIFTIDTHVDRRRLRIVKPLSAEPYAVFSSVPSLKCDEWKPSYSLISSIDAWEAY